MREIQPNREQNAFALETLRASRRTVLKAGLLSSWEESGSDARGRQETPPPAREGFPLFMLPAVHVCVCVCAWVHLQLLLFCHSLVDQEDNGILTLPAASLNTCGQRS